MEIISNSAVNRHILQQKIVVHLVLNPVVRKQHAKIAHGQGIYQSLFGNAFRQVPSRHFKSTDRSQKSRDVKAHPVY